MTNKQFNPAIEGSDLTDAERQDAKDNGYKFLATTLIDETVWDAPKRTFNAAADFLDTRINFFHYNGAWAIKSIDGQILIKGNDADDFNEKIQIILANC